MGRLAISVVGGLAGLAIGMPALGLAAGTVLGGLLFPDPVPTTYGPRLSDLSVTSSAYGQTIARVWGTMRCNGNIIWSNGLEEHKHKTSVGGKGMGGPAAKQVTYSYTCSFAVGLCAGPMGGVSRIWADTKLIWDKRPDAELDLEVDDLDFRFYPGTEDQMPDPHMEAIIGAGQTPAHRGLCYILFEDLDLTDFGNRVPNITVEVTKEVSTPKVYTPLDFITTDEGGYFDTYNTGELAIDWARGYGYFLSGGSDPDQAGIHRFNLWTMREDRQARMSDITETLPNDGPNTLYSGLDGALYLTVGGLSNSTPIIRIDPNALIETARFGLEGPWLSNGTLSFVHTVYFSSILVYGVDGSTTEYLVCCSLFADVGVLRATDLAYVWGAGQKVDEYNTAGAVTGATALGYGDAWVLGGSRYGGSAPVGIYRLRITAAPEVEWTKMASIEAGDLEAGATAFWGTPAGLTYDPADGGVIFQVQVNSSGAAQAYTLKWREGDGIVWATATPMMVINDGSYIAQSRINGFRWSIFVGSRVVQIDTRTGEILSDDATWGGSYPNSLGAQSFDAASETLIVRSQNGGWTRVSLNRIDGEGEPLSTIVEDLCRAVGLADSDIDAGELADIVPGYALARQVTARNGISPLSDLYLFDGVESDGVLRFLKRGRAVVRSLTQSADILRDGEGLSFAESRTQEVDLPARVSITFADPDRDYQEQTVTAQRMQLPQPTMFSTNVLTVEISAALGVEFVKQQAEKLLYSTWVERATYDLSLPWTHADLDPTDVVQVTMDDGTLHRMRWSGADLGADLSIKAKGVAEDTAQYVSIVAADPGSFPAQTPKYAGPTKLFVLDTVLLRDQDDGGGSTTRYYIAMGGYGQSGWNSGAVYRGTDPLSLDLAGTTAAEVTWGAALTTLPDTDRPWATDEVTTLDVVLTSNADTGLDSVTKAELLAGANAAALIRGDGQAEIIQFRNAVELSPGTWRLSGLVRGRRGSDAFTGGHHPGDLFLLLDAQAMDLLSAPLSDVGTVHYYKGAAAGSRLDRAELVPDVQSGNDLKPYAPVHLRAVAAGTDITLSWVRRTRIGGELRSGDFEVPLSEASEAYQVDILDGGGAVLRTLSSTAPSVVYADAVADFGAVPATLHVVVYQISAAVGRGFGRDATIEVEP